MGCFAVPCAWANRCVVAEAVVDLAAQAALRVLDEKRDTKAVLWSRSDKVGIPVEEEGGSPPTTEAPTLGTKWSLREIRSSSVACVIRVSSARTAASTSRMWRSGTPRGCCISLLCCCWRPGRTQESGAPFEGSLHLLSTKEEAVRRHRARMVADLAPAEAKKNGCDGRGCWRIGWAVSFPARSSFFSSSRRQTSKDRRLLPTARSICRAGRSPWLGQDVLGRRRVRLEASVFMAL